MNHKIQLNPENNRKLSNLCGSLDENINQIAKHFDLIITRKGFAFEFIGPTHHSKTAADLIIFFYEKADSIITLEDIQLNLVSISSNNKNDVGQQVELKTKKNVTTNYVIKNDEEKQSFQKLFQSLPTNKSV